MHLNEQLLAEARFWTRIMKEHALFIKLGLPGDKEELIEDAQAFFERFGVLEDRVNQVGHLSPALKRDLANAVSSLVAFKHGVLRKQLQCEFAASITPLLVAHITREAEHFLKLLAADTDTENRFVWVLEREVFWLRIMREHVEFTIHLLDPSETILISQAREFERVFSRLLEEAEGLLSMALSGPRAFPTVIRFTRQVKAHTEELRDFKAAAHELALLCRVLSTVSTPLLIDHVRREADKFLQELAEFETVLKDQSTPY